MPPVTRVRAHYTLLCETARTQYDQAALLGRLLLIDGLVEEGDALLIAASIAGAASLVMETNPDAVSYCIRNGLVDFAVSSADKAMRILKKEISRHQPVAVLLKSGRHEAGATIAGSTARPDLLRCSDTDPECMRWKMILVGRGAVPLPETVGDVPAPHPAITWHSETSAALRQLDLLASELLPEQDLERQNWLSRAPRYMPRAFRTERCVWMSPAECSEFVAAVEERAAHGALAGPVTAEFGGRSATFG